MGNSTRRARFDALDAEEEKLYSLQEALRERQMDVTATNSIGAISSYDQHPGDEGTETYEREKDLGLLQDTQQQMAQIDRAREKLEQGTYGICDECGLSIDPERLEALPQAVLCLKCKEMVENQFGQHHRPLEEDMMVITPNFTRSYRRPVSPAYDTQDTWEDLAEYGTVDIFDFGQDVDDELWHEINTSFPGNPEVEMSEELTPTLEEEWSREYMDDNRKV